MKLELNPPGLEHRTLRRDLEGLGYLADEGPAWIEVTFKPGGYLNPGLANAAEKARLKAQVAMLTETGEGTAAFIERKQAADRELARDMVAAMYDHCVIAWSTNILHKGEVMPFDKDHFCALADVEIAQIADFFREVAEAVSDIAAFVEKADKETEKN